MARIAVTPRGIATRPHAQISAAQLPSSVVTVTSPVSFATPANCLIVRGNGATDTPLTQSTFIVFAENMTNPDSYIRPVAMFERFHVVPSAPPAVATDFHGVDLYIQTDSGSLVNANTNLYGIEAHADNTANTSVGTLVPFFALIDIGAQLATTATDGFVYLPSCAGPPTGVPTAQTGSVPAVYDTTNNKLMVYNAGWKGVVLS